MTYLLHLINGAFDLEVHFSQSFWLAEWNTLRQCEEEAFTISPLLYKVQSEMLPTRQNRRGCFTTSQNNPLHGKL